jgi:hypothetical protein
VSLSALESDLLAKTWIGQRGKPAHRFRLLSTDPGRQDFSSPGTGFLRARHLSRRCVLRRPAGQAPFRYVRPMSASQTLDYDYPYSLAPGAVRETCASRVMMGFGAHHVTGGVGAHAHPYSPLRRVPFTSVRGFVTVSGMLSEPTRPMGPTSDTPVASPAPVFVGPPFTPSRGSSRAGAAKTASTAAA